MVKMNSNSLRAMRSRCLFFRRNKDVRGKDRKLSEDYIEYFEARMADLDPIEGVYYVTNKNDYLKPKVLRIKKGN